jgi:hypothetical protein
MNNEDSGAREKKTADPMLQDRTGRHVRTVTGNMLPRRA